MSSEALYGFRASLQVAEALMQLERGYPNPPARRDQPAVNGLRGGAAVLMVAGFEVFVKAAVTEHLSALTIVPRKVPFDQLPDRLRVTSVYACLEAALKGPRFQSTRKLDRLVDIKVACARVVADTIDPESICQTFGNPGSQVVQRIFETVGIPKVFVRVKGRFERAWGKPEASTFLADKLDEIVSRRHSVAHTGQALGIGRQQLKESTGFLALLAEQLDRQLGEHVKQLCVQVKSGTS